MTANNETWFWLIVLVLLNIVTYLLGRHDGSRAGRESTLNILRIIAPTEMRIISDKIDHLDPLQVALEYAKRCNDEQSSK